MQATGGSGAAGGDTYGRAAHVWKHTRGFVPQCNSSGMGRACSVIRPPSTSFLASAPLRVPLPYPPVALPRYPPKCSGLKPWPARSFFVLMIHQDDHAAKLLASSLLVSPTSLRVTDAPALLGQPSSCRLKSASCSSSLAARCRTRICQAPPTSVLSSRRPALLLGATLSSATSCFLLSSP